jgi:hypothetical protein
VLGGSKAALKKKGLKQVCGRGRDKDIGILAAAATGPVRQAPVSSAL